MSIITDNFLIKRALCAPNMPDAFLPKKLEPIGTSKFRGADMPIGLTTNSKFTKGIEYPVYLWEDDVFVIGSDNVGYKMIPMEWEHTYE